MESMGTEYSIRVQEKVIASLAEIVQWRTKAVSIQIREYAASTGGISPRASNLFCLYELV